MAHASKRSGERPLPRTGAARTLPAEATPHGSRLTVWRLAGQGWATRSPSPGRGARRGPVRVSPHASGQAGRSLGRRPNAREPRCGTFSTTCAAAGADPRYRRTVFFARRFFCGGRDRRGGAPLRLRAGRPTPDDVRGGRSAGGLHAAHHVLRRKRPLERVRQARVQPAVELREVDSGDGSLRLALAETRPTHDPFRARRRERQGGRVVLASPGLPRRLSASRP